LLSFAREIVLTDVQPAIGDVMDVRKDALVDHHLVGLARVPDGVNGALGRRPDGRDPHVDCIGARAESAREKPLRCTGRRGSARAQEAHHAALRAAGGNVIPALIRRFNEAGRAVVNDEAEERWAWILQRRT
jgi:hypothetical protein